MSKSGPLPKGGDSAVRRTLFPKMYGPGSDSIRNYVRLTAESPPLGSGPDSDMWKTGRVIRV